MRLTRSERARLYIATAAAVAGAMSQRPRVKADGGCHRALEWARTQIAQHELHQKAVRMRRKAKRVLRRGRRVRS